MQGIFHVLSEKVKAITKPNPKVYPDPLFQQFMWNRNIASFLICFSFLTIVSIFLLIFNFTLPLSLTFISINIWVLGSFVVFCRSYLWVFNVCYVLISITYGYKGFDEIPEAPYAYTGYIFMITTTVLILCGDLGLTLICGAAHIMICLTKFRAKLLMIVQEEDPEVLVNMYLIFTIFFFILMLLANIGLVRTLDKRTIELFKVKSALENALDQQKTFIFSFSHELRNPINSLLGNLQLVLQGGESFSTKAVEMISTAKVCGEILLHNINNVLDTGKHDMGKLEVNPVPTQLCELFQRTWSIYSELLRQKKLKSRLRIEKDIPSVVKIDPHKVNQLLLNLIGNSIKFTEKGLVCVTIKWLRGFDKVSDKCFEPIPYDEMDEGLFEKEENLSAISNSSFSESIPGFQGLGENNLSRRDSTNEGNNSQQEINGVLKIIVKDTGSGMKKEALEKLFQKFSQVSENVSQRQIGTGLGLFITREICLAMNGDIRAYSKNGVGSTFVVCIPTITVPSDSTQRTNSALILNQLTRKHIKALVADDSPFNVNLICKYISQFGGSVVSVAYNGYDIYMKYIECRTSNVEINVVTLDIDMPIMDGRKVCDKIREYERENKLEPVAIILISGNYDKEQMDEYVNPEKGRRADCFLRKPVSFTDFNRAVYKYVGR